MQALTYYDGEHELANVDCKKYDIVDFFEQPTDPQPYTTYVRNIDGEKIELPKYKVDRIVGTVLNADANHHVVSLLTTTGVVNCKFYAESYAYYNRRLSIQNPVKKDKKTVVEDSWFKRSTLLAIVGFRRSDQFVVRNYSDSIFKHTVNRIIAVKPDGTLELQVERTKV